MDETLFSASAPPRIGVICDHDAPQLFERLRGDGYSVLALTPEQLIEGQIPNVAAWVIDCRDNNRVADAMLWIEPQVLALSNRPAPGNSPDYLHWCGRIAATLDRWTADFWHASNDSIVTDPKRFNDVEAVWVIAGSTGGVPAVQRFFAGLSHIPPVAFIYAQHIHPEHEQYLLAVGNSNPALRCSMALGRNWLNPGHVLIVPAACRLRFTSHGEVFSVRGEWDGAATPNIDELLLTMSGLRPAPGGALILSGTGADGCRGVHALQAVGSRIWVQSPESAIAPSMPGSVLATNTVQHQGSPEQLAEDFLSLYPDACIAPATPWAAKADFSTHF